MTAALSLRVRPAWWTTLWRWISVLALLVLVMGCASLPPNTGRAPSTAFDAPQGTPLGQLATARRSQAGARSDSGFRLLDTVDLAFAARLALVDGATRSLDLQSYAIHADASTEVLLRRIRAAAERGVRVRILLDDFNSVGADAQVLRLAFLPNVQMRLFNPLPGPRDSMLGRLLTSLPDIGRLQKRMHNKMFIADNAWGITGGRNLGDRYFGSGDRQNFVDLDVLAAGRIVRDMSASFDRFWNDELAYPVEKLLDPQELEKLRQRQPAQAPDPSDAPPDLPPPAVLPVSVTPSVLPAMTATAVVDAERVPMDLKTVALTWAPSALLVDQPGKVAPGDDEVDAGETVIDGLLSLMRQAREDVLIVSPYFVPGEEMMQVYRELRARGVRLRVLTNSLASNDAPAAHAGYTRYRDALVAMGVELHEMHSDPEVAADLIGSSSGAAATRSGGSRGAARGGRSRASLHTKAVIIDGRLSVIGSMNLDLRSKIQNSEVALVIRSAALSRQALAQVERTLATGAYRVRRRGSQLFWDAPPGASFGDASGEPNASLKLRLLVRLLGPFAPERML